MRLAIPDRKTVMGFAIRYRLQLLTVAGIFGLIFYFGYSSRSEPFSNWETDSHQLPQPLQPVPHLTNAPGTTQPADNSNADPEQRSLNVLYDPTSPDVDPRYKVPVGVAGDALHDLIAKAECLPDLALAHDQLFDDYNELYAMLTDRQVKEVLFWRIKNRRGFKNPDLPSRWYEFSEAGDFSKAQLIGSLYVAVRVANMHYRVVGGKYTAGDMKFVSFVQDYYLKDFPVLCDWIKRGKQLRGWLIEDGVITADSVTKNSDKPAPEIARVMEDIQKKHADVEAGTPWPIARVGVKLASAYNQNDSEYAQNADAIERARRTAEAKLTTDDRNKLSATLEKLAQHLTQLHFDPKSVSWSLEDNESARIQFRQNLKPTLQQIAEDYDRRFSLLKGIGDDLGDLLRAKMFDKPAAVREAYVSIITANVTLDGDEERKIQQLLQGLSTRIVETDSFTVGEIEDIHDAETWLEKTLDAYHVENKKIDDFRNMLQTSPNKAVQNLINFQQ